MNNNRSYSRERANKFGWFVIILTIAVVIITAVIFIIYLSSDASEKNSRDGNTLQNKDRTNVIDADRGNPLSALPDMPDKPKPYYEVFNGCPPEGDAGDPDLNRLKNRIDEGNYVPVDFEAITKLDWPEKIERKNRKNWSSEDAESVSRYEGIPVAVIGYIAGVKLMGPESCNCHGADRDMRDYHVWISKSAGEDRSSSIVAEVTPPLRSKHPNWDIKYLRTFVKSQERVRISGWLLMDPEHPDQIGKTRGTIWEIHPIMGIEVERNGEWVSIDNIKFPGRKGENA